jgi:hypothetical protein
VDSVINSMTMSTKSGSVGEIGDHDPKTAEFYTVTVIENPMEK